MGALNFFRRDPTTPTQYDAEFEGDACTREGAQRLAEKIEAYWRERGHVVQARTVDAGFAPAMRSARTDVRSDLVNGWPRLRALPSEES